MGTWRSFNGGDLRPALTRGRERGVKRQGIPLPSPFFLFTCARAPWALKDVSPPHFPDVHPPPNTHTVNPEKAGYFNTPPPPGGQGCIGRGAGTRCGIQMLNAHLHAARPKAAKQSSQNKKVFGDIAIGAAQPMPSHCLPDGRCQLQQHLQPTVTTPNRFGNLLQPPAQPPSRPPPF